MNVYPENGPDPVANASLAAAMKRAKNAGVPKDNIENAYKKVCVQCLHYYYFKDRANTNYRHLEERTRATKRSLTKLSVPGL